MPANTRFLIPVKADLIAAFDPALPALKLHTMPKIVLRVARYARLRRRQYLINPLRVYARSQSLYCGNMQRNVKSICERLS
jgi:hypothetical protein